MPIEIKELIIRATVDDGSGKKKDPGTKKQSDEARARLIEECVEQVLEILRKEKER